MPKKETYAANSSSINMLYEYIVFVFSGSSKISVRWYVKAGTKYWYFSLWLGFQDRRESKTRYLGKLTTIIQYQVYTSKPAQLKYVVEDDASPHGLEVAWKLGKWYKCSPTKSFLATLYRIKIISKIANLRCEIHIWIQITNFIHKSNICFIVKLLFAFNVSSGSSEKSIAKFCKQMLSWKAF